MKINRLFKVHNLIHVGILLMALCAMAALHVISNLRYQATYNEVANRLTANTRSTMVATEQRIEEIFRQAYQNVLTISVLPSIRTIDRHGTNISEMDRETIGRLYAAVNARMKISEIYVVPENFNPQAVDPETGKPEAPAIMFDQSITGPQDAAASADTASTTEGAPQVEDYEYKLLTQQIADLRTAFPTTESLKGANPPMVSGQEVITCDNTEFDKTHNDEDRKGIVLSIPYYDKDGKFAGVVAAIIRTNVLKTLVGAPNMSLVSVNYGFEIHGTDESARTNANLGETAKPKLFSSMPLKTDDPKANWQVRTVMPDIEGAAHLAATETRLIEYLGQASIAVVALMAMLGAAYLRRRYYLPVQNLTQNMVQLAAGDLDVVLPKIDRQDLVGKVHGAVKAFQESLRSLRQVEQSREHVIAALAQGLDEVKSGNLAWGIQDPFPAEMERLREAFNDAVVRLQGAINTVKSGADVIKHGSTEIAQASDELSRRTESQAASLAETATAMNQIASTVHETAKSTSHARSLVNQAREDANQCEDVAKRTIAAMSGIERSSQQITQIIAVIDEIAFQTNLLAINAGVEAARAGEVGRGFAVVASEVRALAMRSADAARQIKELIASASEQVSQGVVLVSNTGESLQRIVTRVQEINAIVNEIAASSERQSSALQEVSAAVEHMDRMTSQNAAMAEESTAATHTLLKNSQELNTIVGGFQTAA